MTRSRVLGTWVLSVGVLVGAGCAASDDTPADPAASRPAAESSSPATPPDAAGSSAAEAIVPLPPAPSLPTVTDRPAPTGLAIDALDVADAPVVPVGVKDDGEMEVPGAAEVGWYGFGSRPGDDGAAVLAAHVAYDGVDGVFRHLDHLEEGDALTVSFADGSRRPFMVTAVEQYDKSDLPADVWARSGPPRLVLITCGGDFDSAADSYEDNVVAYAEPA